MQQSYFTFNLYNATDGTLKKTGKYIFQNRNNGNTIDKYNALPHLVFRYITNCNLVELELFFKFAGFSSFTKEELHNTTIQPEIINLESKPNITEESLHNNCGNEEEIKEIIELVFGEGIISAFIEFRNEWKKPKEEELAALIKSSDQLKEKIKILEKRRNELSEITGLKVPYC